MYLGSLLLECFTFFISCYKRSYVYFSNTQRKDSHQKLVFLGTLLLSLSSSSSVFAQPLSFASNLGKNFLGKIWMICITFEFQQLTTNFPSRHCSSSFNLTPRAFSQRQHHQIGLSCPMKHTCDVCGMHIKEFIVLPQIFPSPRIALIMSLSILEKIFGYII